jgi:hypothetical protein
VDCCPAPTTFRNQPVSTAVAIDVAGPLVGSRGVLSGTRRDTFVGFRVGDGWSNTEVETSENWRNGGSNAGLVRIGWGGEASVGKLNAKTGCE